MSTEQPSRTLRPGAGIFQSGESTNRLDQNASSGEDYLLVETTVVCPPLPVCVRTRTGRLSTHGVAPWPISGECGCAMLRAKSRVDLVEAPWAIPPAPKMS